MKIAAAQSVVTKDVAENGRTIRALIHQAAKDGARLVHFCEGALSGYAKAQIAAPEDWQNFCWDAHADELNAIAETCRENRIFAVIGSASPLPLPHPPNNSQYVISDQGEMTARYDKRYLSNSELEQGWYRPGKHPTVFEVDGYRFGCLTCIEVQFPELFMEYERLDVDAILFSSYGIGNFFQIALRAHAGFNCIWISGATPAQKAAQGPAIIVAPDGKIIASCGGKPVDELAFATLDREDANYDIPLNKARPWRRSARLGMIDLQKQTPID